MPTQTGPPPRRELQQRTRRFLQFVAEGVPLDQAAVDAGLSHARALKIIAEIGLQGLAALLPDEAAAA